mgnify:CR=1 FL=1
MIDDPQRLRALYPAPGERALRKQMSALDAHALRYIELSPFVVLATSDAAGRQDASPRGGAPGFVRATAQQLWIPDAPGNHRLDSLGNIVDTGRIGLLFLIPGVDETLRVNGTARISASPVLCERFAVEGKRPATVLVITVNLVFFQCARAIKRSQLWNPAVQRDRAELPSPGEILQALEARDRKSVV